MNKAWLGPFGHVEMERLVRTRSDHASLFLTCGGKAPHYVTPFKVLNVWQSDLLWLEGCVHWFEIENEKH